MQVHNAMLQELAMRILVCLGFVLAASVANAQTYTTINRTTNSTTTTGGSFTAAPKQVSRTTTSVTYITTITRKGGYQPMGAGGYHPMGQ